MGRAGVLYRLGGEEGVLGGVVVKRAVKRSIWCRVRSVGRVFEEENDSIQRLKGYKLGRIKSEELLELNIFDTEILDERCEDALSASLLAVVSWQSMSLVTVLRPIRLFHSCRVSLKSQAELWFTRRTGIPTTTHRGNLARGLGAVVDVLLSQAVTEKLLSKAKRYVV